MLIPFVTTPVGESGDYKITKVTHEENPLLDMRMKRQGRTYVPGTYTFLFKGHILMMSDTPDEKKDHVKAVKKAKGDCLIVGLGIGMVLNAVALKPEVDHIDVIEISQDVIDLVASHYTALYPGKITFHCASIFDWKPERGSKYDMAWFDIWDDLCVDNLEEMASLHKRFVKRAAWRGSWGREYLKKVQRSGDRYYR